MTDFYPELYYDRQTALNQLFCVNGNGYTWENGELVYEDQRMERYVLKEHVEKADFSYAKHLYNIGESIRRHSIEFKTGKDGLNKYIERLDEEKWYPICKYAKICNIPEDIKPDWLELVNECKALLLEDGIDVNNLEG
jgi:hypothetical protein